MITTKYEGSDDEVKLETVPIISNNNNYVKVTDSDSHDNIKNDSKNIFGKDIDDKVEATPKPLSMPKWFKQ